MIQWEETHAQKFSGQVRSSLSGGCVFTLFALVGLMLAIIGFGWNAFVLIFGESFPLNTSFFFTMTMGFMGLTFVFFALKSIKDGRIRRTVTFDLMNNTLSINDYEIELDLNKASHIEVNQRVEHSNNSNQRSYYFPVMIVFQDGSKIWLSTYGNMARAKESVAYLEKRLELPVFDNSKIQMADPGGLPHDELDHNLESSGKPISKSVLEKQIQGLPLLTLRQKHTTYEVFAKIMLAGILVCFAGVAATMMADEGALTQTFFGLFFGGVLSFIAFAGFIFSQRRRSVWVKPEGLEIFTWYDLPKIRDSHTKKVVISKQNLHNLQIHLIETGLVFVAVLNQPQKDIGIFSAGVSKHFHLTRNEDPGCRYVIWGGKVGQTKYNDFVHLRQKMLATLDI